MIEIKNSTVIYQTADISTSFDTSGGNSLIAGFMLPGSGFPVSRTITSVKFNSADFTQQLSQSVYHSKDGGSNLNVYWYTLPNPTPGSNTFAVVTNTTPSDQILCYLLSFSGTSTGDLVSGVAYGQDDADTVPDPSLAITATAKSTFGIMMGTNRNYSPGNNYFNVGSGFTEAYDSQGIAGASDGRWAEYKSFTGIGSKTFDGTCNYDVPPGPDSWGAIAILINGAKEGGPQFMYSD